jgi:hypothetical protein
MNTSKKLRTLILRARVESHFDRHGSRKSKKKKEAPQEHRFCGSVRQTSRRAICSLVQAERDASRSASHHFIKEEKGGYSKKYRVRDASGREWVAKIGKEAQSETSAIRLLWGLGYLTEVNYLVPRVTIPGKGTFTNVRFEARPEIGNEQASGSGKAIRLSARRSSGSEDHDGADQQLGPERLQQRIIQIRGDNGRRASLHHQRSRRDVWPREHDTDLLALTRSRNNPVNYAKSNFFEKVKGDRVVLHFGGKNRGLMKDITVRTRSGSAVGFHN